MVLIPVTVYTLNVLYEYLLVRIGTGLNGGQKRWLVITLQVLKMSNVIILDTPTLGKMCYNVFLIEHVYMYMYNISYIYMYITDDNTI